jgi:hypothetical protein
MIFASSIVDRILANDTTRALILKYDSICTLINWRAVSHLFIISIYTNYDYRTATFLLNDVYALLLQAIPLLMLENAR